MLEVEAQSLTLPTTMGEITVLPHHIPLVANLAPGEIKYKADGKEEFFAVSGGVIEVRKNNEVVVLADTAELGHEIDEKRAEQAKARASKLMQEGAKDDVSFASAAAGLEKHLVRLRVARKHRTHTSKNLESGILHE